MPVTLAAASSATARPVVAAPMPRSWASGIRCVSMRPVVVMPQTKNGMPRPQNAARAQQAARALHVAAAGARPGAGDLRRRERAADRELADVLRPVAQVAPEDRRHAHGEEHRGAEHRGAPADLGNRRERDRHEDQLAGAEAGLDEPEREPAALA